MNYYEGIDYWVRYIEFPNKASPSLAISNGDGTFTIFINTLFGEEQQKTGLMHELRHLAAEHFYRDDCCISKAEAEASLCKPKCVLEQPREYSAGTFKRAALRENSKTVIANF